MNNIGKRIRELRQKNDFTQEKLAGYLNVSFQTVSKWETGINTPDLSMIVPLARILHTTTDDLLGYSLTEEETNALREKLEADWKAERFGLQRGEPMVAAAEALTNAFPENLAYWEDLSYAEMLRARDFMLAGDTNAMKEWAEKSLEHCKMVIEDGEGYLREEVLERAVVILCQYLERREESVQYADMLPKFSDRRERVDRICRTEEERMRIIQEQRSNAMLKFINELQLVNEFPQSVWPQELIIEILQKMIPDGNYLRFGNELCNAYNMCGFGYAVAGRYDDAMEALCKRWNCVKELDAFHLSGETRSYTAPLMNCLTAKGGRSSYGYAERFVHDVFELNGYLSMHDREDFKALEAECRAYLAEHPNPNKTDN